MSGNQEVYERHARAYAVLNDAETWNGLYERPATLRLLGDIAGRRVLDAGCGPGTLLKELRARGADAEGLDGSAALLAVARERLGPQVRLLRAALEDPLPYPDSSFDAIACSLVMHYLREWEGPLRELRRILRPGGRLVISVPHPALALVQASSRDYFATEPYTDTWLLDGEPVTVRFWRRPLSAMTDACSAAGLQLERLAEPPPLPEMRERDPEGYRRLTTEPGWLFLVLRRPGPGAGATTSVP